MSSDYKVYVHIFPNGKMYCGQTIQSMRHRKHGYKKHTRIGAAIAHYGWDNTETVVLKGSLSKEDADYFEQRIIREFQLQNPAFGYNITKGGDGGATYEMTDKRKRALSDSAKQFWEAHPEVKAQVRSKLIEYLKDEQAYQKRISDLDKTRPIIRKRVQCRNLNGSVVGEWASARDAERFFNTPSIHFRGISSVCNGHQKTHGGYIWAFVEAGNEQNG